MRKPRKTKSERAELEAQRERERERLADAARANSGYGLLQPTTPSFAAGMTA